MRLIKSNDIIPFDTERISTAMLVSQSINDFYQLIVYTEIQLLFIMSLLAADVYHLCPLHYIVENVANVFRLSTKIFFNWLPGFSSKTCTNFPIALNLNALVSKRVFF
ncbi:unnamed protein product [Albugo candida]|uniref:Uncharacterized protein n=1 Tax=Albugo candida TaxID=65357 RepID=A0A024GMQ0_9STRA|nr:unnamed protein product [Albugo candida]|eukprot:CCI48048.1 unnamed protein product [Albugo candida]